MKTIKSYSEKNAIKVIAFGFHFANKISDSEMEDIIEKLKENDILSNEFKQSLTDEISMTIGPYQIPNQKKSVGNILFNKDDIWIINITKEFIVITCKKYSKWDNIGLKVFEYMDILFSVITKELNQFTLEYLYEFEILDTQKKWKEKLFNKDCVYLNNYILQLSDFWHINQGSFVEIDDIGHKLLDTLGIKYFADQQDSFKHKVNIKSQHIALFNNMEKFENDNFQKYFTSMRDHSKAIFKSIIHKEIVEKFNKE
ncbi:MAG: TIGR04255 family protein [Sulfurospirillum sp.]|nr:TIGR04255 family protein [Sulfurospirillum sp.]MBL0703049.1 TIGR04255 family protein [Sulfurospirillum sp.]